MSEQATSYAEAKARGLKTYFTGKACPSGHVAVRHVKNWGCVECGAARTKEFMARAYAADPEKFRQQSRDNRKNKPDREREYTRKRQAAKDAARRALKAGAKCSCCVFRQLKDLYQLAALVGYQVDHVVPLSDGGMHCLKNLQMLSRDAHLIKTVAENTARRKRKKLT